MDNELLCAIERIINRTFNETDFDLIQSLDKTKSLVEIIKGLARRKPFLPVIRAAIGETPLAEGVYRLVHGLDGAPVCELGNKKAFSKVKLQYSFCKSSCECKGRYLAETYAAKSDEKKAEITAKHAEVMQNRYGAKSYLSSEHYREKLLNTHGVDNIAKTQVAKEQAKVTNEDRYGGHHSILTRKQVAETNNRRYGGPAPIASSVVRDKIKQTMQKRYGCDHPSHRILSGGAKDILFDSVAFVEFMASRSYTTAAIDLDVSLSTIINYCKKYQLTVDSGSSGYERDIAAFLRGHEISFKQNDRTIIRPRELDFIIESHKLAIEFNGLYFHSEEMVGKNYHREKFLACKNAGYRLISINEDEWVFARKKIEGKLLNILGKSERGPGARKLVVSNIQRTISDSFFDQYHIQGRPGTTVESFGAFCGDELVGAMAFNKQRGTSEIELIRFCSNGLVYPGMFSKMFKAAISKTAWGRVISFADLRYSEGDVYAANDFELVGEHSPDYRYFKQLRTYHKSTFTKKNIARRFDIDMTGKTEREAMNDLGYSRIYDCGKLKYVWIR